MSRPYKVGDVARITVNFVNASNVGEDPTTVTLTILKPDNDSDTPAPTSDGSGAFHYDLDLAQSGIYRYQWVGEGAVEAVFEGIVVVQGSILIAQPPASVTPEDLIRRALRLIGVMSAPGRTASPEKQDEGMQVLNAMLSAWRIEELTAWATQRSTHPTVVNQASYTIGASGTPDIELTRPAKIDFAGLIDSGTLEHPLRIYTPQQWAGIADKATSGVPRVLYYEPTVPNGVINLHPKPAAVYTLVLYTLRKLERVASLTEPMVLPDGYQKAIEYNLALDLAPGYPTAKVPQLVIQAARAAKLYIKRSNLQHRVVTSDYPTDRDSFDIATGEWR